MSEHPYGFLSLAPPVVAVTLAILSRRVLTSLLAGLVAGVLITTRGDVVQGTIDLFEKHLWSTFVQPDKLRIVCFTLCMGATIALIHATGGMRSLVAALAPLARGRRSGQLGAWLAGLVIFFDDYANCMLLGNTLAPVFDRLKLSREKLAYIVDSTAAPVAGLAVVSTWIAVELAYLQEGLANTGAADAAAASPFSLFVACIPYRFYVIQALLLVMLVAVLNRDFGPMLRAERAASAKSPSDGATSSRDSHSNAHWLTAAAPIIATLLTVLALIYATGRANLPTRSPGADPTLRNVFGAGSSSVALQYGGLVGLTTALALSRWGAKLSHEQLADAAVIGVRTVLPAIMILWLASAMSRMTSNRSYEEKPTVQAFEFNDHRLYTGDYLKEKLLNWSEGGGLARWLPTVIFVLASIISFCTGTSFGTMGILVPMVVPLAYAAIEAESMAAAAREPLFLASLGSVLAGAIFGDHCSPISDTTILSSQFSGCDHIAHVNTQLPYAMLAGGVSILLGTLLIGFGVSVWLLLPLQTATMIGVLLAFGDKVEENPS